MWNIFKSLSVIPAVSLLGENLQNTKRAGEKLSWGSETRFFSWTKKTFNTILNETWHSKTSPRSGGHTSHALISLRWAVRLHLNESNISCSSLFKHKAPPYWLVVNFIRMSIVIIAYLVLIILRAVKSIRHNPISFCRSEVHTVRWFTVRRRPS